MTDANKKMSIKYLYLFYIKQFHVHITAISLCAEILYKKKTITNNKTIMKQNLLPD